MIQEAWKRILEIRGKRLTSIGIDFWHYDRDPGKTTVAVHLWDGKELRYGKTLEDLIKLAEVSMSEPKMIDGELPEAMGEKGGQRDG